MCAFCSKDETIEHLFFDYLYAKFLCRVVHFVLGLKPLNDIHDLFPRWYKQGGVPNQSLLFTGCVAICWTIWLTRNEVAFDKCRPKTFLQIIFRGTYRLRQWA